MHKLQIKKAFTYLSHGQTQALMFLTSSIVLVNDVSESQPGHTPDNLTNQTIAMENRWNMWVILDPI